MRLIDGLDTLDKMEKEGQRSMGRWAWYLHPSDCSLFAGALLELPWQAAKSVETLTSSVSIRMYHGLGMCG